MKITHMTTLRAMISPARATFILAATACTEDKGLTPEAADWALTEEELAYDSEDALDQLCVPYDTEVETAIAEWMHEAELVDDGAYERLDLSDYNMRAIENHNRARGRTTNLVPRNVDVYCDFDLD